MARQARVYIEGVLYYVTSKCGHDYNLFIDPSDYREYISLVTKYKARHGFKLFSYVLMPDHLHMLIELKNNVAISNIMHDVNSLYTKLYNSKYGKKGHLFQERFKTVLAEKEIYLLSVTREIHMHPVWQRAVTNPKDHPYSSYPQFLNPNNRLEPDIRREVDEVFRLLGGTEREYEDYTKSQTQSEHDILNKSLQKRRILGSASFHDKLNKMIEESVKRAKSASRNKTSIIIMAVGGAAVVVLAVTSLFLAKGTVEFKSKYDKTAALYNSTLQMLENEKATALRDKRDVEALAWKIELTEKALQELKEKRVESIKDEKALDGYMWNIKIKQTSGPVMEVDPADILAFKNNTIMSEDLKNEGFAETQYSKRETKAGVVEWETIQRNGRGETVNWRGGWNGDAMSGVLRRQYQDGAVRDFSFVSDGFRVKEAN